MRCIFMRSCSSHYRGGHPKVAARRVYERINNTRRDTTKCLLRLRPFLRVLPAANRLDGPRRVAQSRHPPYRLFHGWALGISAYFGGPPVHLSVAELAAAAEKLPGTSANGQAVIVAENRCGRG